MRYLFSLLMYICSFNVIAQVDTIYTPSKRIMGCIIDINRDNVRFNYPGETVISSIDKGEIQKIVFLSGRSQSFSHDLTWSDFKEHIPNFLSGLTLIASLFIFWITTNSTKENNLKNNSIPALIDYLREWRGENGVIESYHFIRKNFSEEDIINLNGETLADIKDTAKGLHAIRVSHYFDNLGLFIYGNVLDGTQLISFVGSSAYNAWIILEKYIINERRFNEKQGRDRHYQIHFQYFVAMHLKGKDALNNELDELLKSDSMVSLENQARDLHNHLRFNSKKENGK